MSQSSLFLALVATTGFACAQGNEDRPGAPEGQVLIDRAKVMEKATNQQLERDKTECYQQILVNKCLSPANARHREALAGAHRLEVEGANLKRKAKLQEKAAKTQKDLGEDSRREAEQTARAEREQEKRARRDVARLISAEEENARSDAFQKKYAERETSRQRKANADAADFARRQTQKPPESEREREYATRAARVAERKKSYAAKLEREAVDTARKQAALESSIKADQERDALWSPRRWIKD